MFTDEQINELTQFILEFYNACDKESDQKFYLMMNKIEPNNILNGYHKERELFICHVTGQEKFNTLDETICDKLTKWADDMSSRFPVKITFQELSRCFFDKKIAEGGQLMSFENEKITLDPDIYIRGLKLHKGMRN